MRLSSRSLTPLDYDRLTTSPRTRTTRRWNPPASVGPDQLVNPGDPDGVEVPTRGHHSPPAGDRAVAVVGCPSVVVPPLWGNHARSLTDTAWTCVDLNASLLATMPPYLVNAAPTLDAGWLRNPEPSLYSSWDEFAKQLFWDYQAVGEAFVLATSFYSTGWPATFHVIPPWTVQVDMDNGLRRYRIGCDRARPERAAASPLPVVDGGRARPRPARGRQRQRCRRRNARPLHRRARPVRRHPRQRS